MSISRKQGQKGKSSTTNTETPEKEKEQNKLDKLIKDILSRPRKNQ
jgi:hypothetical protein